MKRSTDRPLTLVTGASAGIGAACATRFAVEGHDLALWARRLDRLDELAGQLTLEHGTNVHIAAVDVREFSVVRFHGDSDRAEAVYEGFEPLAAADVADAVWYVASRPPHVNVFDLVVTPTAQRDAFIVDRPVAEDRRVRRALRGKWQCPPRCANRTR